MKVSISITFIFLANKTRATQKNTSKQQPKIGNSNKRYTLKRTTFTCKTHNGSNLYAVAAPARTEKEKLIWYSPTLYACNSFDC